jgi:hypothetical protein
MLDARKALLERERLGEADALDAMAGKRRDAARILERAGDIAIAEFRKLSRGGHESVSLDRVGFRAVVAD